MESNEPGSESWSQQLPEQDPGELALSQGYFPVGGMGTAGAASPAGRARRASRGAQHTARAQFLAAAPPATHQ